MLKRLNESGELRLVPRANGKHAYLWQKPVTATAIGPEVAQFIRGMDNRYHISGDQPDEEEGPDRDDDAPARPRARRRRSTK